MDVSLPVSDSGTQAGALRVVSHGRAGGTPLPGRAALGLARRGGPGCVSAGRTKAWTP